MTAFVLVPGARQGVWWHDPLVEALTTAGHTATALTLVGSRTSPTSIAASPSTPTSISSPPQSHHAAATAGAPAALVGHSYAGVSCVAAADRSPERVAALVLLDAFLPVHGDSCCSLTNHEQREWYAPGCAVTGDGVEPLAFFDERARPHPSRRWLALEPAPQRMEPPSCTTGPAARLLHDGPTRVLELVRHVATLT